MDKIVNFQIEEALPEWLEDYSEEKFTVFKTCFLSTSRNSHHFDISEEVLKRDASTILGNFLVAKVQLGDATTHLPSEIIYGYFPKEQEIEFEEVEINNEKIVKAWAYCVISKQYGQEFNEIFDIQNLRDTSVEMTVQIKDDQEEGEVLSFNIYGLTCLGLSTNGSCPDAMMTMVRFSEEEATNYFNEVNGQHLTDLDKFVNERKESMAEEKYVSHPIDTSKKGLYEGEWDGNKAKQDLVKEKNFKTLAPKVCMKLEEGWEDREVTKLGYPVMGLYDGKWRYSAKGLASALGYAKKEEETAVVSKIEKIYKKLGLDSEGKEEKKMSKEIKFAAVDLGDMWGALRSAMSEHSWYYYIDGVYEEDNQKFAIIVDDNDAVKKYRLDFNYTEDGLTVADEITEVKVDFIPTENIKKFAEPENAEEVKKCAEPDKKEGEDGDDGKDNKKNADGKTEGDNGNDGEKKKLSDPEPAKMSVEEMEKKLAELQADVEEKENIIMEKDKKLSEQETELSDLREFKAGIEKEGLSKNVEQVMADVKDFIDNTKFAELREEGLACDTANFDAWSNKVKATCFSAIQKKGRKKQTNTVWSFSAPTETESNVPTDFWSQMKTKYNA